ncbi:MAG: methionyl-tRNA formyltransferase [Clostridia bacterium]|nr:methionyl-tRNA formyltransferase [Clostridia bacterium]
MKLVFAGSPEFAVPALNALYECGADIVAVITQPDKPVGRKKVLTPTPVKVRAQELNIPVYDFLKIREHADAVRALGADIMITCAYGQILTQDILNCFKKGVWNLHASLLPQLRGASPVQSAILEGKTHTGVTVMRTELSLDTGDMLLVKRTEIGNKTYGELEQALSKLAAEAAVKALSFLESGKTQLLMQDEAKATYCKKISKSDGKINFENSADEICRLVRAMNPQPVAYCMQGKNALNVLRAEACADESNAECGTVISADKRGIKVKCKGGAVIISELIPAGGKRMSAADYANGRKIKAGDRLD